MTNRLLHITASLERCSTARSLVDLVTALPRDEFEVQVATLDATGPLAAELADAGVAIHSIGRRRALDPVAYANLRQLVSQLRPALVQTWNFAAGAYGRAAAQAAGIENLVGTQRHVEPRQRWMQRLVERRLDRRTTRVVATSDLIYELCRQRNLATSQLTKIPAAVPPHVDQAAGISREQLLAELKIEGEARLMIFVGRLELRKGLRDVLWTIELLKTARDGVHLLVVGDGPLRETLVRYRDLYLLRDRVHFLGPREDVSRLLELCDLAVSGNVYGGLSRAVLEAMAAGLPVVATDTSAHRELVLPEQTGYLTAVGDTMLMARYVSKILDDAPLAERLGAAARRRVAECFSHERMVASWLDLYRELLSG
ncbi:MAG: glycosyltransferase [Planctomycetota bacterium]|nr:MAG: glycosyltransferase [Planctomycetota bacterium]REK42243.1 MAG: glycosyltransferase [Planctomycetota bacterium]